MHRALLRDQLPQVLDRLLQPVVPARRRVDEGVRVREVAVAREPPRAVTLGAVGGDVGVPGRVFDVGVGDEVRAVREEEFVFWGGGAVAG